MNGQKLQYVTRLGVAALVLFLILVQPNHPHAMTWGALKVFPLELPVILCVLVALPAGRFTTAVRLVLVGLIGVIAILKAADFVSFNALSRGFNPVADLALIEAFVRLLSGSLGALMTLGALIVAGVAIIAVFWLLWWATGVWAAVRVRRTAAWLSGVAAIFAGGVAAAEIGQAMGRWTVPIKPYGAAFTARVGIERVNIIRDTLIELAEFRVAAKQDSFAEAGPLLDLIDRDVLVIFVESYGRTSLDTPYYADLHRQTLLQSEDRLVALGLSMQSGVLASPTRGGQSWLAHATFANGLWVDNQIRYGAALSSGRDTLFHHAAENGFHTGVVMPQITLDWPEAELMGFETILPWKDLGYRGLPFNWVTMPDQFTLGSLDRLLRTPETDRHVFAQVALISSHAPWVPVPDLIDWDVLGDGQVFNEMATAGDPPDVVWKDRDRIRAQYRQAVDYALRVVFDYAALHAEDPPLILMIGDHQAAEFVALDDRPDVPIHIIGPQHLVARLDSPAFTPGLIPPDDAVVLPMDRMRDIILRAYTGDKAVRSDNLN